MKSHQSEADRCDEVLMLISAECDGAASEEEKLRIARHTARCGDCAKARAEMLTIGAEVAGSDDHAGAAPGADVWDAIEAHLRVRAPVREGRADRAASEALAHEVPAGPARHAPAQAPLPAGGAPAAALAESPPAGAHAAVVVTELHAAPAAGAPAERPAARRAWVSLARAAAVAGAVTGAFVAGRASAPQTVVVVPEVAQAPVSVEAEKKALLALTDVLSMVGAGRGGASPAKPRPTAAPAAPAHESEKKRY